MSNIQIFFNAMPILNFYQFNFELLPVTEL